MQRRPILLTLVILAGVGWWVLRPEPAASPEAQEASLGVSEPEPATVARQEEQPPAIEPERATEAPVAPPSSDPLDRQRWRLLDTSARLAARREAARTSGAPETTLHALDAHLARVQQRIAALDETTTDAVSAAVPGPLDAVPVGARRP